MRTQMKIPRTQGPNWPGDWVEPQGQLNLGSIAYQAFNANLARFNGAK